MAFPINPPEYEGEEVEQRKEETIEQFWIEQFVIVAVAELASPINPPEEQEGEVAEIEQFWIEQFVIVVVELAYPINPPE